MRELNLELDDLLTVASGKGTGVIEIFGELHKVLLELDLFVKHVFSLILLLTKAGHDIGSELLLELKRVLDFLDLLLLSLKLFGFLFLLGHSTTLNTG